MTLRELVLRNRSYRRFHQEVSIELETLRGLVDLARYSASAGNHQPLKYLLSCDPEKNALIFAQLGWAAYLKDWPGPAEGERPSAYIIILGDRQVRESYGPAKTLNRPPRFPPFSLASACSESLTGRKWGEDNIDYL